MIYNLNNLSNNGWQKLRTAAKLLDVKISPVNTEDYHSIYYDCEQHELTNEKSVVENNIQMFGFHITRYSCITESAEESSINTVISMMETVKRVRDEKARQEQAKAEAEASKKAQPAPLPVPLPASIPTQPASLPPATPMNPYDMMVQDITSRILQQVGNSVNEEKVNAIIEKALAAQGKTRIILEDRRKNPVEITEIEEPVHKSLESVIGILKTRCWCAVVGPTGSGKTLGALQFRRMAKIDILCIKQMTNIIAQHDLLGFVDANGCYRKGAWTDAIVGYHYESDGGELPVMKEAPALLVVDEMDNGNPNVSMILKALQTGHIMMPYGLQEVNPGLSVLATLNTWGSGASREYVGRMAQDAALLNEFNFVEWDYDTDFEWQLVERTFGLYKDPGSYTLMDLKTLMNMFIVMRKKAAEQKVRLIISTRNIINSVKILIENPTWAIHKVLCMTVYKGLKEEDIKRVECPELWTHDTTKAQKTMEKKDRIANAQCPI